MCGNGSNGVQDGAQASGLEGFSIDFHEVAFGQKYQRNNKRGGLKNLRCFPSCATMHKERGFCGRTVKVKVTSPHSSNANFMCIGKFALAHVAPAGGIEDPSLGEIFNAMEVENLCRTPKDITKPYVPSETEDGEIFVMNRRLKGWNYGWQANKHSCNAEHVLKAYMFRVIPDEEKVQCVAMVSSPAFVLFCRRRRRFEVKPTAPIAPIAPTATLHSSSRKVGRKRSSPQKRKAIQDHNNAPKVVKKFKTDLFDNFTALDAFYYTSESETSLETDSASSSSPRLTDDPISLEKLMQPLETDSVLDDIMVDLSADPLIDSIFE